jgi:hypothetical protein
MNEDYNIPIVKSLALPQCRYMICWSLPFCTLVSVPFALIFSYYNSQGQKKFKLWNVKVLGKDLLLFSSMFSLYAVLRTLFFDPYCDPKSIHYDKNLNAFDRKKRVVNAMQTILESEGKLEQKEEISLKPKNN